MNDSGLPRGRVMLTGAGGLIGKTLAPLIGMEGYELVVLYRDERPATGNNFFRWNPGEGYIEPGAFEGVTHIIHLAGAGIGDRRWSKPRKREIVDSRVESARLLYDYAKKECTNAKCYITASGTGYYGSITSDKIFTETDQPGDDFLATTCVKWEDTAGLFGSAGIRSVVVRTGVVLSPAGGFVEKVTSPMKAGIAAWFGDGRQYIPWIHINDICRIYLKALSDDSMSGVYNAVAPGTVTQKELILALKRRKKIPAVAAGIPTILVRAMFGEMSSMLLQGSRVSPSALITAGFDFNYPTAAEAVSTL